MISHMERLPKIVVCRYISDVFFLQGGRVSGDFSPDLQNFLGAAVRFKGTLAFSHPPPCSPRPLANAGAEGSCHRMAKQQCSHHLLELSEFCAAAVPNRSAIRWPLMWPTRRHYCGSWDLIQEFHRGASPGRCRGCVCCTSVLLSN